MAISVQRENAPKAYGREAHLLVDKLIGQRLAEIRGENRWRKADLAKCMGVSGNAPALWEERFRGSPRSSQLVLFLMAIKCTPSRFFLPVFQTLDFWMRNPRPVSETYLGMEKYEGG